MSEHQLPPVEAEAAFVGPPLAVGSVYGLRQWGQLEKGLTSTGVSHIWRPEDGPEFEAECKAGPQCACPLCLAHRRDIGPHRVAMKMCSCGFYAYYGSVIANNWSNNPHAAFVRGVIEGYGLCTLGTDGFRASKARIVALVDYREIYPSIAARVQRIAEIFDVPTYPGIEDMLKEHPLGIRT